MSNQYVAWPTKSSEPGQVYRVTVGSGMRQLCSDEASSSSFYVKCEQSFALVPAVKQTHGILEYLRFKDDIIVIVAGARSRHDVFFKREVWLLQT